MVAGFLLPSLRFSGSGKTLSMLGLFGYAHF
jgi:hypothetical protein